MSDIPEAGGEPLRGADEAPATPRPAATVILLRRGGKHAERGLEVCLGQRNPGARFMPGVWVFPGGAVDAADGEGEPGFRAAAARELEEEVGISVPAERAGPVLALDHTSGGADPLRYALLSGARPSPLPSEARRQPRRWTRAGSSHGPRWTATTRTARSSSSFSRRSSHLESLLPYANAEEALEAARKREVKTVEPEVVGEGSDQRVILPEGI